MGLVHEDDVNWFLTLDETHHEFSTVGTRGGAAAGRYINTSFPWSGERCIVSTFHTTGVYGTTMVVMFVDCCVCVVEYFSYYSYRRILRGSTVFLHRNRT